MPALILIVPVIAAWFGERPSPNRVPPAAAYVLDVRAEPFAYSSSKYGLVTVDVVPMGVNDGR